MSTKTLGKREYNNRNEMLKRRLKYYGLEHIQKSGWVSKKGMTDEQIQAVLTELFRENCNYDIITEIMDISIIDSEIYDYIKLAELRDSSDPNQGRGSSGSKKRKDGTTQSESDAIARERYSQLPDNMIQDELSASDDDFEFNH